MSSFRNLRTQSKILFLVGVAAAALLAVALLGYRTNATSAAALSDLYRERLLPLEYLKDNQAQAPAILADMLGMILSTDDGEIRLLKADYDARVRTANENFAGFEKSSRDAYERQIYDPMMAKLKDYRAAREEVLSLAEANRKEEAYRVYAEKVRPIFDSFYKDLNTLAQYQVEQADQIHAANQAATERGNLFLMAVPAAALLLLVLLGIGIARMIARPVRGIAEILGSFSELDFAFHPERGGCSP